MYMAGWPFWTVFARRGARILFRVRIEHDSEASVYIASSPDLKGLVVEAETLDELKREAEDCIAMLMDEHVSAKVTRTSPWIQFQEHELA